MAEKTTEERHASWLELFFDLTVVAAAAQIAHRLHGAESIGQVAACAAMFYAIWSVWTTTSVYANVAGERTRQRAVLRTMLGIAIMAAAVPGVWPQLLPGDHGDAPEGRTAVFVVAFLLCRVIASRSAARDGQVIAFWPATQSVVSAPWLISLFVPPTTAYWLWGIAIAADIASSMLGARSPRAVQQMTDRYRRRQQERRVRHERRLAELLRRGVTPDRLETPPSTLLSVAQVERGHLDERLGLFVIIVLGEALAQLVDTNSEEIWTWPVIAAGLVGFLLLVQLWRLTTLYGFTPAPRSTAPLEPWQALPAHLGVTASIVTIAAGLGGLIPVAGEHLHTKDRWYLFGGIALYLLTSLLAGLAGRAPLKWYLGWAGPSLLAALLLALFGHPFPAWSLAVLAYLVPAWFASYNRWGEQR
ncbi:low temperature requirement protein LtrA [Kribbella amoyensis]|uniref:Low temperature requirement protein LtrA n=1 Tax=Kribbella amoyensis TaxID=996641 RepID=A0A561B7U5_9ACTN|nr:low temperature requirement protein A [Kribbella amoyensis]TWD75031.1 low temperature requirement protein LtrA [Kribbella amoyensis]